MLYIVTGGAGFIGSHLTDALVNQGHRVRVVDDLSTGHRGNIALHLASGAVELVVADVAAAGVMQNAMQDADGCFHLAAIASVARGNEDWLGTHRVNLSGSIAVFDAARAAGRPGVRVPVVYASSAAVYGDQVAAVLHEGLLPRPMSAYGADKLGSELHGRVGHLVHGVPTMGFRFFNVYGPRQDPASPYSGVISIFAERIGRGLPIRIDGDGWQTRDFIYVADVVAHLIAGMGVLRAVPQAGVFNVCTGRATSIRELAEVLGRLAGRVPEVVAAPPRAGDIRSSLGAPEAAVAALGVVAGVSLEDGLRATLESLAG